MVTTDKVYENREWLHGYREEDAIGGYDPYSSSKGAAEIAIASWRRSFFAEEVERFSRRSAAVEPSNQQPINPTTNHPPSPPILLASARAGNVIGGGDWALDRIVPDAMRALAEGEPIPIRNAASTRPWQHVLEPLSGYLLLAARLAESAPTTQQPNNPATASPRSAALCSAFNFGPPLASNRPVRELVEEILKHWPGDWRDRSDPNAVHEAGLLNLSWDKAFHLLGWQPKWEYAETIRKTVEWYREARSCKNSTDFQELTRRQVKQYCS